MKKKKSLGQSIYSALEQPRHRYFLVINNFLGIITAVSVLAVILETVPYFSNYLPLLISIEYVTVTIFTIEYIIRIKHSSNRIRYIFSFYGLIDLITIVPTILGLSNLTFLKAARAVRVVRMLRTLRLIKVARFSDKKEGSRAVLGLNFEIYATVLAIALVLLGTSFYVFEFEDKAPSILHGMYWAFQVIIGERHYSMPDTLGGVVTMVFVRFTALIFFGLAIGIIGAILRQKLTGSAKDVE